MKKISLVIILAFSALACAQTTTTVTGVIKDLSSAVVTSGQVTFTLKPGADTTISGTARFSPSTVTCAINGSGLVKAADGLSVCTLVNNTALTPAGTYYQACIQPQFVTPGSCFNWYALGTSTDITTVVPTPGTAPAFTFVDTYSNQTIAGNKTFTGTTTFSGSFGVGALTASSLGINALGTATSGANFNSGNAVWNASIWNGSMAIPDAFTCRNVVGTGANPTATLTCTHSGSSGAPSIDMSNTTVKLGTATITSLAGSANVKGPNPWWDVCQNGFACDGVTSDTAAFNTLIAAACNAGGGTLWIPPATTVRFGTAPNHIVCGLTLAGAYSKGSAFGFGSFIKCDYTEASATNACLWWDGANAATQGNGGGIRGINIQKGDGKTGGAAIKISGTDCTARAGNIHVSGVKVSSNTGTWNYGLYVDGTTCTTLGQQGSRDNSFIDVDLYGATTKAASLNGCSHCYTFGVEASIGAGSNADIDVTGTSTANASSNDVLIVASAMTNLKYDWATNVACAACNVTGTFTTTANNTSSLFTGTAAAISNLGTASLYLHNQAIVQGTIFGTVVVSGAQASSCTVAGEMCEATSATGGSHFIGSDAQFFFRRNTGSAAGSNFTWSYDGGGTFPFAFDATNGFSTTLAIVGPSMGLKNGFTATVTPSSIAANRAISINDPLNSAVLPTYIQVTDTVDLASVATGACTAERTVAATGARFGDSVTGGAGTAIEAGGFIVAKVSAADAIKWQLCNLSGGNIDRASDTYTLRVIK